MAKTVVYLRSMRTPARHWEDDVLYDDWGSPYIKHGRYGETALLQDGKTSDTYLNGTEWRHKSGPPVTFPDKPTRPFP